MPPHRMDIPYRSPHPGQHYDRDRGPPGGGYGENHRPPPRGYYEDRRQNLDHGGGGGHGMPRDYHDGGHRQPKKHNNIAFEKAMEDLNYTLEDSRKFLNNFDREFADDIHHIRK